MRFQIVIIGFGSIGRKHLKVLRSIHKNIKVYILTRQKIGNNMPPETKILKNMDEVININPDVVLISSPASSHIDYAHKLLRYNIPLFIEKPISNKYDTKLRDFYEYYKKRKNKIVFIGYHLTFSKSLKEFKNFIKKGKLGKIISIRSQVGQDLRDWRVNVDYSKSVSAKKSLGGGVLRELSHDINYLQQIFGKYNWVQALLFKKSELKVNVEDTAFLNISCKDNKIENIINLNIDFTRQDKKRECVVIGSNGTLKWDGFRNRVDFFSKDLKKWKKIFSCKQSVFDMYRLEWNHFFSVIKNKEISSLNNVSESIQVLKLIEQAEKSNKLNGKRIMI